MIHGKLFKFNLKALLVLCQYSFTQIFKLKQTIKEVMPDKRGGERDFSA